MSSSRPPADDVPSLDLRSRHRSFAWGESPIRPGELPSCRETSWVAEPSSTGWTPCSRPPAQGRRRRWCSRVSRAWGRRRCCWRPLGGPSASAVCGREGVESGVGARARRTAAGSRPAARGARRDPERPGGRAVRRARLGARQEPRPTASWSPRPCCRCWPPRPSEHRSSCSSTICSGSTASQPRPSRSPPAGSVTIPSASSGPGERVRSRRSSSRACRSSRSPGLTRTEARILLRDRVADRVADRLVDDTGGNPLAMLEIASRLTDAQRIGAAPLPDAADRR